MLSDYMRKFERIWHDDRLKIGRRWAEEVDCDGRKKKINNGIRENDQRNHSHMEKPT
ncbi:hypothetical protein ACS0TY_022496 [Phlomoides rotata]